jgi:hypothetical protein
MKVKIVSGTLLVRGFRKRSGEATTTGGYTQRRNKSREEKYTVLSLDQHPKRQEKQPVSVAFPF